MNCALCDYETNVSVDFNAHITSLKHIEKKTINESIVDDKIENKEPSIVGIIIDKYKCSECGSIFKHRCNLNRHKRTICSKKNKNNTIDPSVNDEIEKLKEELKKKDDELKKKDDIIKKKDDAEKERLLKELNEQKEEAKLKEKQHKKELNQLNETIKKLNENQIKTLNTTVTNAGNLAVQSIKNNGKSLNLLKYLTQHYPEAPQLKSIPEDRYIELAEGKYCTPYTLIYYYRNNLLHQYLGDFIVNIIKKQDPSQNPVWIKDLTRNSYYIKSSVGKWTNDKKGVKFYRIVLTPMFERIIEMLKIYNSEQNKLSKNMKLSLGDMAEHNRNNNDGDKLIDFIKSGDLGKNILSCMGKHFLYHEDWIAENTNKEIEYKPDEVKIKNKDTPNKTKLVNSTKKINPTKNIKLKSKIESNVKPISDSESELNIDSDDDIQIMPTLDAFNEYVADKKDMSPIKIKSSDSSTSIFKKNIYGSRFKYRPADSDSVDAITDESPDN